MEIVTLAYNRPDFIKLQLNSLEKWVKQPFKFTVYDNCPDDAIKDECRRLGIECIPLKLFSSDPSWVVGLSLDKMWLTLRHNIGELWYLDSDMFLIDELPKMDCDMAFVPQVRKRYTYPWTGLMYFNMDKLPFPEELKWHVDYDLKDTDVGGHNHFYLQDHAVIMQEFQMWTIIDEDKFSYNGSDLSQDRSHGELTKLARKYDFPRPYSFDVFRFKDKSFVFHYKSASNYPAFYTQEYNNLKTEALKKIL